MKVDELRVLEVDELGGRLKAARRELYELRFKHAVGQLENSSQISKVRHDIARIMTVLRERDFGILAQLAPDSIEVAPSPLAGEVPAERGVGTPKLTEASEDELVAAEEVKPKRTRTRAKVKTEEGA
ncbi:MAG TPA: 50S ribosomal protein L29 [Candidatus Dormibacteraeota bacterium]|nr:50S ribosomal protein L29 [Candidatus Dormibacteraeota bacterium]